MAESPGYPWVPTRGNVAFEKFGMQGTLLHFGSLFAKHGLVLYDSIVKIPWTDACVSVCKKCGYHNK